MNRFALGVDVGGTFTDLVLVDQGSGTLRVAKVPTTVGDQASGFLEGLARLGVPAAVLESITHGTTIGTNAILERKGARCGLITTRGFRDVLELGRRTRPYPYGMIGSFEALIPRELRLEVDERVDADGHVLVPLDEEALRAAIDQLLARGAEALVIHFLHSYANPVHEERAYTIARERWPNPYVTAGARILPEFREFERGTAAALNGYIQPLMTRYIGRLAEALKSDGFASELLVMQGNGGMLGAGQVVDHAVQTVMSGPAAGALAAARLAAQAGFDNVISCDMGGTSFDVALIRGGQPAVTSDKQLAYGVPLRVQMVDIHTIGAGGGSIARVNRAGILQIGPESAGAVPGPICYGRGGTRPTVTDANVALGRLDPRSLPIGAESVAIDEVRRALEEQIGRHLGLDADGAAAAILTVTNQQLAGAIRLVSIERGHDPRDFALLAFGGAGPLHAVALARELGIPSVVIPRFPGLTSALGCVLADVRHDFVQTINRPLLSVNGAEIDAIFNSQAQRGRALIARERVGVTGIEALHEVDLLYQGQTHVLRVPLDDAGFDPTHVLTRFAERYRERFDIELPEMRAVLVNVRTTVIGRREPFPFERLSAAGGSLDDARAGTRRAHFDGAWLELPVYRRERLGAGARLSGPAIIEQLDATTLLEPGVVAEVDEWGHLVISPPNPLSYVERGRRGRQDERLTPPNSSPSL
jgi:N-methylhydantoinase A